MGRVKKLKKLLRHKEVEDSLLREKGIVQEETDVNAEILPAPQDGTTKASKKNIIKKGSAIQSESRYLWGSLLLFEMVLTMRRVDAKL